MTLLWIFLAAVLLLLIASLALGYYIFTHGASRRDREELFRFSTVAPSARIPYRGLLELAMSWYEEQKPSILTLCSRDGLSLSAELLEAESPKGVVLCVHGFRSWPAREFAPMAKLLHEQSYTLLLPYQRAHRKSEGDYITFGVKERYDMAQWAQKAAELYPALPLFLYGQSMGGASVILAAGLGLPTQTKGIIADAAYSRPYDVIAHALKYAYKLPIHPVLWSMNLWAKLLAKVSLYETDTAHAFENTRLPFLFIHGTADDMVPYEIGKANYELCQSEKELVTVKDAGHCAAWYVDTDLYESKLLGFLAEHTA